VTTRSVVDYARLHSHNQLQQRTNTIHIPKDVQYIQCIIEATIVIATDLE